MRPAAARFIPAAAFLLVSMRVNAVEVAPRDAYILTHTILGAAGGAALGAAAGGLSRPDNGNLVTPFLRWGAWGMAFGAVAGTEVGLTTVGQPSDVPGLAPPPSREAGACLGALVGELAGLGAGSLAAHGASRKSDSVWAGVALGALLGAGVGYLVPPRAFIPIPPPVSESGRSLIREQGELVPLVPVPAHAARAMAEAESGAITGEQIRPTGGTRAAGDLDASVSTPPASRTYPGIVPVEPPARPMQVMAMLEGIMLGGSLAASMPGDNTKFWSRASIGGGIGMLAGLSAGSALVRSWNRENGYIDSGESMRQGTSTTGTIAGGLLGTILGAATGAALRNSVDGFGNEDAARCAVAGNLTGLFVGYLLSSPAR
jgi:hypothetical protein